MYEAAENARESIYWEIYILRNNTPQFPFVKLLEKKARAGVRVRIILDRFGSFGFGSRDLDALRAAGADIRFFNTLLKSLVHRTHRKIFIVDEKVCFLGGVNVAEEHRLWRDLTVKLSGRIVRVFVRSFARIYIHAGGADPLLRAAACSRTGAYPRRTWLLEHWPFKGRRHLNAYYRAASRRAEKSIQMVTPYFAPHPWLLRSLIRATRRGVAVSLLLPARANHLFAHIANIVMAASLSHYGVRTLLLPSMIHAKVLIIDGHEGMIGSNNIDAQSFDFNLEASVVLARRDMVGDLRRIMRQWENEAVPFEPKEYEDRWYSWFFKFLTRLLQPIL